MRTVDRETRREFSAVPVVVAISAIVVAALWGSGSDPWGRNVVTVGLPLVVLVALTAWVIRSAGTPAVDAPQVAPVDDSRYRILVVADDPGTASSFVDELRSRAGELPLSVSSWLRRLGRAAGASRTTRRSTTMRRRASPIRSTVSGRVGIQVDGEGLGQRPAPGRRRRPAPVPRRRDHLRPHSPTAGRTGSNGVWSRSPNRGTPCRSGT